MGFIKAFVKKQIQLDKMNIGQKEMFRMANVGVADIKNRATAALNANDAPSKPLTKGYAIKKAKVRRTQIAAQSAGLPIGRVISGKRDLMLTGDMMRNLSVRSVSENRAYAGWTTLSQRKKAANNERLEHFIDFSPKNEQTVHRFAQKIVSDRVKRLVITKGGVIR